MPSLRRALLLAAILVLFDAFVPLAAAQDKPEEVLSAVVGIEAKIQAGARSRATLGPQRSGNGVLIRDDYVLTIGYLVVEAESIRVTGANGTAMPATLAAYDHASGFGLLKLSSPVGGKPMPLGDSSHLAERQPVLVAGANGPGDVAVVHVVSRRPFAGNWEYLLDAAIFTYPAVRGWSGAPLIGAKGELLGIGSLIVPDAGGPGTQSPGNMFVPIELLAPILDDLIAEGARNGPRRPWLGLNTDELRGHLFVARVSPESPAALAGIKEGDIVLSVGSREMTTLPDFYRAIWSSGAAGVEIPLKVLQGLEVRDLKVRSIDRSQYFRPSPAN